MSNAAFLVVHINPKNIPKLMDYLGKVGETTMPYKAEVVFRGARVASISGEVTDTSCNGYPQMVTIRFPDIASIFDWYTSAAYQELIPLRLEAADMTLTTYTDAQH